jgi:hypothetical protein
MFSFVQYSKTVEQMMQAWYAYTKEVLRQSGDLGFAREHFVQNVLASFLPKSVIVGSGEIIDGEGRRSSQQDIIVYRAGFPVITSLTPINTFLSEGVIATIEVKSRLSTGEPNLHSAFKNVKTVLSLEKRAEILSGTVQEIEKLKEVNRIRTYVIGYSGWKDENALLEQYRQGGNQVGWSFIPHLVYQPGVCVLRNDGFINPKSYNGKAGLLLHSEYPFSLFLHHLLKAILLNTGDSLVTAKGIKAIMNYDIGTYFNFKPPLAMQWLELQTN